MVKIDPNRVEWALLKENDLICPLCVAARFIYSTGAKKGRAAYAKVLGYCGDRLPAGKWGFSHYREPNRNDKCSVCNRSRSGQ